MLGTIAANLEYRTLFLQVRRRSSAIVSRLDVAGTLIPFSLVPPGLGV